MPPTSTPADLLSGTHPPANVVLDQHITRLIHEDAQQNTHLDLNYSQFTAFVKTLNPEDTLDLINNFIQSKADQIKLANPYLALAGDLNFSAAFLSSRDITALFDYEAARNRHLGLSFLEFTDHIRLCHPDNLLVTLQQIADEPVNFESERDWPILIRVLDLLSARRVIAQLNANHVPITRGLASLALKEQVQAYVSSVQFRLFKRKSRIKKTSFVQQIYEYGLDIGLAKADALRSMVDSLSRLHLDVYRLGIRAGVVPETLVFYMRFQYPGLQTTDLLPPNTFTLAAGPAIYEQHGAPRAHPARSRTECMSGVVRRVRPKGHRSRPPRSPSSDWSPIDSTSSCESAGDRTLFSLSGRSLRSMRSASLRMKSLANVNRDQSISESEADFLSAKDVTSDDSSFEDFKSGNSSQNLPATAAPGPQKRTRKLDSASKEEEPAGSTTPQSLPTARDARKGSKLIKPASSQKRTRSTRVQTGTESQFWSLDILDRSHTDEPSSRESSSPLLLGQNANARRYSPVVIVRSWAGPSRPNITVDEADLIEDGHDTSLPLTAPARNLSPTTTPIRHLSQPKSSSVRKTRRQTGTKSEHFLGPPPSSDIPSMRTRKGISCLRVPPLSAKVFGLIQEELADNPFHLLVAVVLLNKTRGEHAIPTFRKLIEQYPTPKDLAAADRDDVLGIIRHLGLQNQRAKSSIAMAKAWEADPPTKGRRHRTMNYPSKGMHTEIKSSEIVSDDDEREAALEIAHLPACGPYAYDSWRIFCRDKFRGLADGWNGEGAAGGPLFEPEWMRVVPLDKELRAFLRWQWLKEGWDWDPLTGDKEIATEALKEAVNQGNFSWDGEIVSDGPSSISPRRDLQTSELSVVSD